MREGLYDSLLTARLARALDAVQGVAVQTHGLEQEDAPARFARFLADEVCRLLGDLRGDERVEKQAAIVNEVIGWLQTRVDGEHADTGVLRLNDLRTEIFFVTLDKSEGGFSSTTSYRDYAISRDRFHWETQNSAADDTPTGRRYVEQDQNGWRFLLFARETREDAFVALGPVRYLTHTGERPMGITWTLDVPMPAALFERFAALLAA